MDNTAVTQRPDTSPMRAASNCPLRQVHKRPRSTEPLTTTAPTSRVAPPDLTVEDLRALFHLPIGQAAKKIGICNTFLKKLCRKREIHRWPYRQLKSIETKRLEILERMKDIPPNTKEWEDEQKRLEACDTTTTYIMHNPNTAVDYLLKTRDQINKPSGHAASSIDQQRKRGSDHTTCTNDARSPQKRPKLIQTTPEEDGDVQTSDMQVRLSEMGESMMILRDSLSIPLDQDDCSGESDDDFQVLMEKESFDGTVAKKLQDILKRYDSNVDHYPALTTTSSGSDMHLIASSSPPFDSFKPAPLSKLSLEMEGNISDYSAWGKARTTLVLQARRFLSHPSVSMAPSEDSRNFLRGKGMTEAEISAAESPIF